jgi:hypothetical protein
LELRLIEVMIDEMLPIQFGSSVNLIQMWLMKVIYILKNILIQEFQHSLESRLIEVMIHEMLPIQFVSSVNLIQMWLMKVIYNIQNNLIQEFQYSLQFQLRMIEKHFESISDAQHQSETHFQ